MKWLLLLPLLPPVVLVSGSRRSDEEGATTKAITEDVDKTQLRQIVKESSLMFQQYISINFGVLYESLFRSLRLVVGGCDVWMNVWWCVVRHNLNSADFTVKKRLNILSVRLVFCTSAKPKATRSYLSSSLDT